MSQPAGSPELREFLTRAGVALASIAVASALMGFVVLEPLEGRVHMTSGDWTANLALLLTAVVTFGAGVRAALQLAAGAASPRRRLSPVRKRIAMLLVFLAALQVGTFAYARWGEPFRLTVRTVELPHPAVRERVRLVAFSDVHSDTRFDLDRQVADTINALKPDVVLFLGDALNEPERVEAFRAALGSIQATTARFAVRGNWDVWFWSDLDLFGGTGFDELRSGWRTIEVKGTPIRLGARSWVNRIDPSTAVGRIPAGEGPAIFITHPHDFVEAAAAAGADLYLCGDTHGGQIELPVLGPLFAVGTFGKRYARGHYRVGGMDAWVTAGIGVEDSLPLRFGVRPEILAIDVVPGAR